MVVDDEAEGIDVLRGIAWGLAIAAGMWVVIIGVVVWLIWCR